jgi:hypothetical protein
MTGSASSLVSHFRVVGAPASPLRKSSTADQIPNLGALTAAPSTSKRGISWTRPAPPGPKSNRRAFLRQKPLHRLIIDRGRRTVRLVPTKRSVMRRAGAIYSSEDGQIERRVHVESLSAGFFLSGTDKIGREGREE